MARQSHDQKRCERRTDELIHDLIADADAYIRSLQQKIDSITQSLKG